MKLLFKLSLLLIFTTLPLFLRAQEPYVVLKGKVTDSTTKVPVGYATIILYLNDTTRVKELLSEETGNFVIAGLKAASYKLVVTSVGYRQHAQILKLDKQSGNVSVNVPLAKSSVRLTGITVKANRNLISSFGGGFQFNPRDASVNKTGSAADLLGQVPGVTVEDNSDIKLKGSPVRVMVNGKLINLSGQELQNYLKSIDAARIVNVTVNTNPSAKYDAATSGGLIDIQLKNKFEQGFYASVSAKYETLPGTYDAINADYTKNRFTLSLGLTYLYRKDLYLRDNYIINKPGPNSNYYNLQHGILPQKQEVVNPRLEVSYSTDSASFLTASVNFPFSNNSFPVLLRSDNQDIQHNPTNSFLQNEAVNYQGNYATYNVNYVKNYKSPGRQLNLGGFYTNTVINPSDHYTRDYYLLSGMPDSANSSNVRSDSKRHYRSSQLQADFTLPLAKGRKLSMGLKNSHSLIDSDDPVELYDHNQQTYVLSTLLSSSLHYKENIAAAYVLFNQAHKKISYGLGIRFEQSDIAVNSDATSKAGAQHYGDLFPNANFSYRLSDFESIDFSASRKIDRPPYSFLDPFVNTTDPNNYLAGNPELRPSYINNVELQYSKEWNTSNSTIVTLSYADKTNVYLFSITTFSSQYNHVITTYSNANDIRAVNLSLIGNNKLAAWWQLNSYAGVAVSGLKTDSINNLYYKPKPYFSGSLTNTFTLSSKSLVRVTGYFNSTSYQYQAKLNSLGSVNAGYQRSMLDKKLTLNIDAYDIFKTRKYTYFTQSNYYYERSITTLRSRYFSVALSYVFGRSVSKHAVKKLSNERLDI